MSTRLTAGVSTATHELRDPFPSEGEGTPLSSPTLTETLVSTPLSPGRRFRTPGEGTPDLSLAGIWYVTCRTPGSAQRPTFHWTRRTVVP